MFFLKWLFDRTPDDFAPPPEPEGGLPPLRFDDDQEAPKPAPWHRPTQATPMPVLDLKIEVTVLGEQTGPVAQITSFLSAMGRRIDNPRGRDIPLHDTVVTILYRTHGKLPRYRRVTLHSARNHFRGVHLHSTCHETGEAREFRLHNTLDVLTDDGKHHDPRAYLTTAFGLQIEDIIR